MTRFPPLFLSIWMVSHLAGLLRNPRRIFFSYEWDAYKTLSLFLETLKGQFVLNPIKLAVLVALLHLHNCLGPSFGFSGRMYRQVPRPARVC